ncbi:MAG: nucleotidyltransferase family protein [Deltaproteobacteria bacterium]|nr:nucleotidyltransferase family protein [Deltaproteobacteria bacterium]
MTPSDIFTPSLSPEEHLILNCLRSEFSGGSRACVSGPCPPDIKWNAVFEAALTWNIAPMVYRILPKHQDSQPGLNIPEPVLKAIEAAYVKTYLVNQSYFSDLTKLIGLLAEAEVEVILLKGAHLTPFVYQDLGMRWMADIDILVRKEDFQKADRVLLEAGYRYPDLGMTVWEDSEEKRELSDSGAVIEWYKTHHMHLNYSNPETIQNLEVHWAIVRNASPFAIDTEGLWERARQENLNGQTVLVLSPEDLILHISVHDAYYHHLKLFRVEAVL